MHSNTANSIPCNTSTTSSAATRWTLDPGHSAVGFSVRHLMIANVRGEFSSFRGELTFDPAHPEETQLTAAVDVASLATREAKRDDDLRGPLFFDVEKHPQLTFVSKSTRALAEGAIDVTGELTIRGITREVTLAVREISGPQLDMRGAMRIGAVAKAQIKRSEFEMTWNKALETGGVVVGDVVTITIDASLVKSG